MEEILISCIMSNYNTEIELLCQAIESILNQSLSSFELIIIDDCSTNGTRDVLNEFSKKDNRIRVIYNKENHGLAYSLNKAIKESRGEYIARMDTDDIANPLRFEKQLRYINKYKLDVCGTFANKFGTENGLSFTPFYHEKYSKAHLLTSSYLIHPSVIIRKSFIIDNNLFYNEEYRCSQDVELWVRMSRIGRIGTLNQFMLNYRIHGKQVSKDKNKLQKHLAFLALKSGLDEMNIDLTNDEIQLYKKLCEIDRLDEKCIPDIIKLIRKIISSVPENERKNTSIILYNKLFNIICKSDFDMKRKVGIFINNIQLLSVFNVYSIIYRLYYEIKYYIKAR